MAQWLKESPEDGGAALYRRCQPQRAASHKNAIEQYEWLLSRAARQRARSLNNLAWAYQQIKDKRALETAERAYKLKPDNPASRRYAAAGSW